MRRTTETDDEWSDAMEDRKHQAERSMLIHDHKKRFCDT
jgi:hypothetical protein